MAKGKSAEWLTEDGLLILKGLERDGCSDKQIYERIGISKQTYYSRFLGAQTNIQTNYSQSKETLVLRFSVLGLTCLKHLDNSFLRNIVKRRIMC